MRHLTLMAFAALALAGCNGGEDFSDATVPGCPLGAACQPSLQGEILIEVLGPRVANLGYKCGSTTAFTSSEERTSDSGDTQVPAFHALCPASASSVEFYLGSGLFEGNRVSLGDYLLPQETTTNLFQLTLADLLESPRRIGIGEPGESNNVVNRAALLHALDSDGDPDNEISIPEEANTFIDTSFEFVPDIPFDGYATYADFVDAWETDVIPGIDAQTDLSLAGFVSESDDIEEAQEALQAGNDRSRAGSYTFEVALEWLVAKALLDSDSDLDLDQIASAIFGEGGDFQYVTLSALVLPDGRLLGGGSGVWATGESEDEQVSDYLGFDSKATLSDILELQDQARETPGVRLLSGNVGDAPPDNTDALVSGRFLGSGLYVGVEFEGRTDVKTQFPSAEPLDDAEKGRITGKLLGQQYRDYGEEENGDKPPIPFRAFKEAVVQSVPDQAIVDSLDGVYWVRLMQACVDEDDLDGCSDIPDPTPDDDSNEEAEANYSSAIEQEKTRTDEANVSGFCLSINAGLITMGVDGACGNDYTVGFVTRTFEDPRSANIAFRLAPGLDVKNDVAHYNTTVEGRIDLTPEAEGGDGCRRLFRTADQNFDGKIRARWIEESYLPEIRYPEPADQLEEAEKAALSLGAVQFFAGSPGNPDCDPMAP